MGKINETILKAATIVLSQSFRPQQTTIQETGLSGRRL